MPPNKYLQGIPLNGDPQQIPLIVIPQRIPLTDIPKWMSGMRRMKGNEGIRGMSRRR